MYLRNPLGLDDVECNWEASTAAVHWAWRHGEEKPSVNGPKELPKVVEAGRKAVWVAAREPFLKRCDVHRSQKGRVQEHPACYQQEQGGDANAHGQQWREALRTLEVENHVEYIEDAWPLQGQEKHQTRPKGPPVQ